MVRLMDWSVVVLGCAMVLVSLAGRRWERATGRAWEGPERHLRVLLVWFPLLAGLMMIGSKAPHLLGASHSVTMIADTVDVAVALAGLFVVIRSARRYFQERGARPLGGPSQPNPS